ncbi:MAG: DUF192 domain-containing protein [Anaerolineae bacterium]
MKVVKVLNAQNETLLSRVKWGDTVVARGLGLMLRRSLAPGEGFILAEPRASIVATSITMFFVNFDIAAIWLDGDRRVVHKTLARAWRPYYASTQPARYVLEGPPALLDRVALGDVLNFEE